VSIKQPSSQSSALRGDNEGWHWRNSKEKGSNVEQVFVLPQLEMLPKKNAPYHSQAFSIKANSY